MRAIIRTVRDLWFILETAFAGLRWRSLSVDGLLRKRRDTQIIISQKGRMHIGHNVTFQRNVSLTSVGADLQIGNNVFFNRNCIVICRDKITIQDDVIFGPNVVIYDHDHVFDDEGIKEGYNHGAVVIEKGCWIAANVIILRNTHIGEGCVIGAGAVVKGDIPAHSLVKADRELTVIPLVKADRSR